MLNISSCFFLLMILCWLHVDAQVQPASAAPPENPVLDSNLMREHVPRWLKAIQLRPNESLQFEPGKLIGRRFIWPSLRLQVAMSKTVLKKKKDSLFRAARSFVNRMRDSLHLNKTSKVLISIYYFDKYRYNAGLSRQILYNIDGRNTRVTDSTSDETGRIDSAINSRLDSFRLMPNQYLTHNRNGKVIGICNITSTCKKDIPYAGKPNLSEAKVGALRLLFEVIQYDYPRFTGVGFVCIDPWGGYSDDPTGFYFERMDLAHGYNDMYLGLMRDLGEYEK